MAELYLDSDNRFIHQLRFKPTNTAKVSNYGLSDATEVIVEFYKDRTKVLSLSSASFNNVKIEDEENGTVSYTPLSTDFNNSTKLIKSINFIRWRVVNPRNTLGLVFGYPAIPVTLIK